MLTTENVKTYLMDAWPDLDGEKRLIKLRCYINPVSYELAQEMDPAIASTLFHKLGPEMAPRSVLNHCRFSTNPGPQSLTYCRDPQHANSRVFLPAVSISKVEAGKVTPESNDFALMFTVSFEKNDRKVLDDLSDLLHEHFFCTFAELQPSLFQNQDPVMDLRCRLCEAENPAYVTTDNRFAYCEAHSANHQEGEVLRRIRDSAKAAVIAEAMGREPGDEASEEEPKKDPLSQEAEFINQRNRRVKSRRAKAR